MNCSKPSNGSKPEDICLACGLCCDGVIFVDVKLQADDNALPLLDLGAPIAKKSFATRETQPGSPRGPTPSVSPKSSARHFPQPCFAFDGCKCRIYSQRPKYCRKFECLLLRSVKQGRTEKSAALEVIRTARRRADTVWRLLRELGDVDEDSALSVRFRRMAKRLEKGNFDEETASVYGELTLAVHDLNCLISEAFYPR